MGLERKLQSFMSTRVHSFPGDAAILGLAAIISLGLCLSNRGVQASIVVFAGLNVNRPQGLDRSLVHYEIGKAPGVGVTQRYAGLIDICMESGEYRFAPRFPSYLSHLPSSLVASDKLPVWNENLILSLKESPTRFLSNYFYYFYNDYDPTPPRDPRRVIRAFTIRDDFFILHNSILHSASSCSIDSG